MGYHRRSSGAAEQFAAVAFSTVLLVLIVGTVITFRLMAHVLHTILQAFAYHPRKPVLWIMLLLTVLSWGGLGVFGLQNQGTVSGLEAYLLVGLIALAVIAPFLLYAVSFALNLRRDDLLQVDTSKDTLIDTVLHKPWWSPLKTETMVGS